MKTTLLTLLEKAKQDPYQLVCYDTRSPWWCLLRDNPYRTAPTGPAGHCFPASPRGSLLLETELDKFLTAAIEKGDPSGHYGKHGLNAFMLAYEGNLVDSSGRSIVHDSWVEYNLAIELGYVDV